MVGVLISNLLLSAWVLQAPIPSMWTGPVRGRAIRRITCGSQSDLAYSHYLECIGADNTISHRTVQGELVTTTNFIKPGPLTIGVTCGASTPDK